MRGPLSLIGRYLPIGLLAAAQVAVMVIAPSVAPSLAAAAGPGSGVATGPGTVGTTGPSGTTGGAGSTQTVGGLQNGPGTIAGKPAAASGDTSHCVAGREFSPQIAWFAPPCQPGTPGGVDPTNGGATWRMGVTGDRIEILDYVTNYGAEINAILAAEGALVTYNEASKLAKAYENFLNRNFVFWGRKVHIDVYAGQCNFQDDNCILPEIDGVIQKYHPYAVFWQTPVCPECFSEIAHDGAIGFGGLSFSDEFTKANAPFFYDSGMTSTQLLENWAEWWCSSMTSVNSSRRVTFTSDQNSSEKFNGQKRVLGFVTPNKPDDENAITDFLWPRLQQLCGEDPSTFHKYYYAQDINTAAQQVAATIAAMNTTVNPATDVLCVCDIVAPQFLFQGEADNNYWPENMIADTQGMGVDVYAQNYDVGPKGSGISCPNDNPPNCAFDSAVGLTVSPPSQPQTNDEGTRIWRLGCGCSDPLPSDNVNGISQRVTGQAVSDQVVEFVMMGMLIENSGPQLDPWTMQKAALNLPAVGGGQYPVMKFSGGGYNPWHWTQSTRVAWWDPLRTSQYNGKHGTWVSYPSPASWRAQGGFPSEPGGPAIPPAARRTS